MKDFKLKLTDDTVSAWVFCIPAILVLGIFLVSPFFMAVSFSFTNQLLLPNPNRPTHFTGLQNYIRLFTNRDFYAALSNNIKFSLVIVPVQAALALFLAVMINQRYKGSNFFRLIYFTPVVISMVAVSVTWALLLNPDESGFLNVLLNKITFGYFKPVKWLQGPKTALPAIMIFSIWQGVGFQMVIYLAGLQQIPGELYEAAHMDGTTMWQRFRYITFPQLRNTNIFVLISITIFSFKLFTQVFVLTEGGPRNATTTMIYLLYKESYVNQKIGYPSAIAVVFFIIVLGISLVQRSLTNSK